MTEHERVDGAVDTDTDADTDADADADADADDAPNVYQRCFRWSEEPLGVGGSLAYFILTNSICYFSRSIDHYL